MINFGLPYQGSKSKVAAELIRLLPPGNRFVDVFAGGCAMTHAALLSGRWQSYLANDVVALPQLFKDAIDGKYNNETRWISREDFAAQKDSDAYVRIVWSFGNNGEHYLYSREIEPWRHALHALLVWKDPAPMREFGIITNGSRQDIINHHAEYKEKYVRWYLQNVLKSSVEYDKLVANLQGKIKRNEEELRQYLLRALKASGLTQAEVQRRLGTQMAGHYFGKSQWAFPTKEYYEIMQTFMPLPESYESIYGLQSLLQSLQSLQRLESLQSLQSLERLQRLQSLQRLESLERLQSLQRLESLESLQSLESLESRIGDYRGIEIRPGDVVYCDPPYKGKANYNNSDFDHEAFYDWVESLNVPVYISEYSMPADRFLCVKSIKTVSRMSGKGTDGVVWEKLFVKRPKK